MMTEWLNTKELAKYLSVHEKKIYEFVDKRGLPGTRITGKWMFRKDLVDLWLEESMENTSFHLSRLTDVLLIAGSNDPLLEQTAKRILPTITFFSSLGSSRGLDIMRGKKAHLAGVHLYSPEKDEYNIPFLAGLPDIVVVNFAHRLQGILTGKGNPQKITGVRDLAGRRVRVINRQGGSGTRVLFDELLKDKGIPPGDILGYENEVATHLEVGLKIFEGKADAGLGIETVARYLDLEFLPIKKERFDLLIPRAYVSIKPILAFLETLRSDWFRDTARGLGGYDIGEAGKIIFES